MSPTLLIVYVVVLVVVVRMAPRLVHHPVIVRLRVLFPSWRFFDAPGDVPRLFVRWGPAVDRLGPWHAVAPRPRRHFAMLAFNPEGNLAMAQQALLQSLVDAIEGAADDDAAGKVGASVPYALTARLAREHVRRLAGDATSYQFKLGVEPAQGGSASDLLISEPDAC